MKEYTVAIVGATGAVGEQLINLIDKEDKFPIKEVKLLASARSVGKTMTVRGKEVAVQETTEDAFEGVDIALFSAGGDRSKQFAPAAVASGAVVIDNTSAYRMDPNTPLVVPEVNPHALDNHNGIIANPNCSTIQMVVALEPIRKQFGLKRIIVSTYQAVSGAGTHAIQETLDQSRAVLDGEEVVAEILPSGGDKKHYQIAFNALAQIDKFDDSHYTFEELKMRNETRKIMEDETMMVTATCVRIPVISGHSESVYIEVDQEGVTIEDIMNVLRDAPGIVLEDDIANQIYPQPVTAAGKKDTFVGRIRKDMDDSKGFHLWIVSDNLIKGAAWNSVQIAETMVERGLI